MINTIVNTGFQNAVDTRSSATVSSSASSSSATQPATTPNSTPDAGQLKEAVTKLNDYVQNVQRNLSFSVDKDSGQTVIKVYDAQTKEVIRQLPPEETLKLAASIDHQLSNLLVKDRA